MARAGDDTEAFVWKLFKYRLLLALDRPQEIENVLRAWIRPEVADNYWRRALAYVAAEQGRVDEAIALVERVEADHGRPPAAEVGAANVHFLWYFVRGRAAPNAFAQPHRPGRARRSRPGWRR